MKLFAIGRKNFKTFQKTFQKEQNQNKIQHLQFLIAKFKDETKTCFDITARPSKELNCSKQLRNRLFGKR